MTDWTDRTENETRNSADDFARQAEEARTGVVREFVDFLRDNKTWWLLPIVLTLAIVGIFVLLASSAAAPFIYTLF